MSPTLRSQILRLAAETVRALDGDADGLRVTISWRGGTTEFAAAPGDLDPPAPPRLSACARVLLPHLTDQEQAPKRIAAKAKRKMGSHINAALRELVRAGLAVRCDGGGYKRLVAPSV